MSSRRPAPARASKPTTRSKPPKKAGHTHKHTHKPAGKRELAVRRARGLLKALRTNKRMSPAAKAKTRATLKRKYGVS